MGYVKKKKETINTKTKSPQKKRSLCCFCTFKLILCACRVFLWSISASMHAYGYRESRNKYKMQGHDKSHSRRIGPKKRNERNSSMTNNQTAEYDMILRKHKDIELKNQNKKTKAPIPTTITQHACFVKRCPRLITRSGTQLYR